MMNNEVQNNEFLSWDGSFIAQDTEFILLDEGVYNFKITKMERKIHSGSEKIPNGTPFAEITYSINTKRGTTIIKDKLFLLKNWQWKLTAFFKSVGQKVVDGQPFQPNWNVVGATGKAEIGQHEYTNRNGDNRKSNQISRYLAPNDPQPALNESSNQQTQQAQQNFNNFNNGAGAF